MSRSFVALLAALALACGAAPRESTPTATASQEEAALRALAASVTRENVAGDVWHYLFTVPVGTGPNAYLRIHRVVREKAPWRPRESVTAAMLLHGDFATFETNFAPSLGDPPSASTGLAGYLARRGVDVWGLDRRWTNASADPAADVSDFATMGLAEEIGDVATALAFARGVRLLTDHEDGRMKLMGFSHGGQLAYVYAAWEAARPAWQRHVDGLVPLDVYASLGPADEDLRLMYCDFSAFEYQLVADGEIDSPNTFVRRVGANALAAPDAQTPMQGGFPGFTNAEVLRFFAGQTYFFFPATPVYHLAAPVLDQGFPVGLRHSTDAAIATWFAGAAPHQSMLEAADFDAMLCNEAPLPVDAPLSRIRVPVFALAAAGGYGERALFSASQVGASDVQTLVIRRLPVAQEEEDFGHGDLLYAADAERLAWAPLMTWLAGHR
ncbi:MAG: hypothetical protein U0229_18445 [Anaeromyxobacter sp.]